MRIERGRRVRFLKTSDKLNSEQDWRFVICDWRLEIEWAKRREKLLEEKIDVTAFFMWFIEGYPATVKEVRGADKSFWERFR